ncbi:MAG: hypothetical protein HY548_01040 [Elusimicrobia bacterium]|nr:hypothetical protein [Elusimicrobiota bacterium]
MRITRTSINQGGSGAAPMSSAGFRVRGTVGEVSLGTMSSASRKVSDGLMRIYFYPGTITSVAPTPGTGAGTINLAWTAPGADGDQKTAAAYVVKYSTHPAAITDQNYFANTATLFQIVNFAQSPGSNESLTINGLQPGTSYYIAIEARDAAKNQAYLSNSTYTWAQVSLLSVDIQNMDGDPDTYGFGTMNMSSAVVSTSTIRVTNTGTTPATWSLRASTITVGSPWQITTGGLGIDAFRMSAAFHGTEPLTANFGVEDRLDPANKASSGADFTVDGSSTGVNVPVGNYRNVWLLLETPTATSTTQEQQIQMTVTAGAP